MARQTTEAAQVARIIRKKLKDNKVQAKVTFKNYSGGNSVHVDLIDPSPATVRKVQDYCDQFSAGDFNGMIDCYEYRKDRTGPTVKYLIVQTDYSDDLYDAAEDYVKAGIDNLEAYQVREYTSKVLRGTWGDFWTQRKPRILAVD